MQTSLVPVTLPDGRGLNLAVGGRNPLVKRIVDDLCPRFSPGGVIVYVGDTGEGRRHLERDYMECLGLRADLHDRMPDVVVHHRRENWLVLIDAATSRGPIDTVRHNDLKRIFKDAKGGLVFVTAFPTRGAMAKCLENIAWKTEVWLAEEPDHLIHFGGGHLREPYARSG